MPMGTTSNLALSMALKTDAAESSDTSCSPLRPPNRIPTRSFFMDLGLIRLLHSCTMSCRVELTRAVPRGSLGQTGTGSWALSSFFLSGELHHAKTNLFRSTVSACLFRVYGC